MHDLHTFGSCIQQLIDRKDLSRERARACIDAILRDQQPDLQQGAFLAALAAKGATAEETAAAWASIDELDTIHVAEKLPDTIVENAGTGMDRFKTCNVSTAAAIVAAAAGVPMARHGARALTGRFGTVDICETLGIDVEAEVETVAASIRRCGIGLFNGMSPTTHPAALGRLLAQLRFGTIFHSAASLASPARPKQAVRGVFHVDALRPIAETMQAIGYRKAILVHGEPGMDEFSTIGRNHLLHLDEEGLRGQTLDPADLGIAAPDPDVLRPLDDLQDETDRFRAIIAGTGGTALTDLVALNAAAVLLVAEIASDWRSALDRCRALIADGSAAVKLDAWIRAQ